MSNITDWFSHGCPCVWQAPTLTLILILVLRLGSLAHRAQCPYCSDIPRPLAHPTHSLPQSFNMMVFVMAIRAGLTAKKNSPDESSVRLFETTLRALLNPRAFALVRQNQAKARWTKVR